MILLIHPPVSKPSEPPAGLARLAGALKAHDLPFAVLDANLEGLLHLLKTDVKTQDTWTKRALRNRTRNLNALRDWQTYQNPDRYIRVVKDLGRVLEKSCDLQGIRIGLANYSDEKLSPLKRQDLTKAFQSPEENPYYPYFSFRLPALVEKEKPDWIGFSLNFLSQALCAFAMIGFLKRDYPGIKVVLGGGLVTSWMRRRGWDEPFKSLVDKMISGPGEGSLLRLLGLSRMEEDHFLPDFASFPLDAYLTPELILPYSASSGCYWSRCTFCPEQTEGNPYLPIPLQQVTRELKTLCAQYHPFLIHFTDNALSPRLLQTLIQDPPGAPWYGFTRCIDYLADPDFCLALKKSGCIMLKLGLESGDQDVLDRMNKGHSVESAERILQNLKTAGIATYVYLLFGTQYETLNAARKTRDFILCRVDAVDFLNVAIFNMPLYSTASESLQTRPFYEGDLSLYTDFVHPQGWSRREVRVFLDREFKKEPSLARILKNDPPFFTSNHAPLFVTARKIG